MVCCMTTCNDYATSPGMDLPSKNMYDEFKDEIWKELGPLDPDWFHALTAQTSTIEDNVSDVSDELCANQEAHFKAPLDKTAQDSQLFSTPKAFRRSRVTSPETEDEQSFAAEEKETLPWKETQSPHLFGMAKERVQVAKYGGICPQSQDGYDLLHRTPKSPVSYAKKISETLGAQVDSDISWTSSLNTPPAVPSTLILSKPEESLCPVSVSADKNVVFVRKLFPSLSNSSRVVAASSKNRDVSVQQGVVSPEAPRSQSQHQPSPKVWRQKLPDAIEDGDVRRTVANVLDGAENVLSIFFSNSGSALRKVKTDRVKRKQIIPTKEQGCSFTEIPNTNSDAFTEQRTDDQDLEKPCSPLPLPSTDIRTTQWSPLSLSEIPPWTTDASCCENSHSAQVENNVLQSQRDSNSSSIAGTTLKSTPSGFIKKKRKFIYTVDASKTEDEGKETLSQINDTSALASDSEHKVKSVKLLVNEETNEENLPLSLKSKLQDLDMSQLCRDFAQDFSQMLDPDTVSLASENNLQNGFSASACLTAMRQAKEKARRANLHLNCDAVGHRKLGPATNLSCSINEGTVSDSGFQSAVADVSHLTTTLPSSENCEQMQRFTNGRHEKPLDDVKREAETNVKLPSATEENQTLDLCRENEEPQGPICAKETDNTLCQVSDGFKTASNKAIRISSTHLERAKCLFEENEVEKTQRGEIIGISDRTVKNTISNSNQPPCSSSGSTANISCQLTASQKADVTELCILLEEADSQFEFTQFKMTKPQQQDNSRSLNKVDKELDPDFLLGIDFDESFSVDADKHTSKTAATENMASFTDGETSGEALKVASKSSGGNKNAAIKDGSSSSKHNSEGDSSVLSAKPQNLNKSHNQESNPLMPGAGFRTATGNILRVSRKCISKAGALFADLEADPTDHKSTAEQSSEADDKTEQSRVTSDGEKKVAVGFGNGFQMASGKGISISARAMQEADALFKDCDISHNNTVLSVKLKKNMEQSTSFSSNAQKHSETLNIQEKDRVSEKPICEFEKVNVETAVCHTEVVLDNVESQSFGIKDTLAVTSDVSSHGNMSLTAKQLPSPSCVASKNWSSSDHDHLSSGGGFSTASGKKVSVSANALKKAESLLNEVHMLDSMKEHLMQQGDSLNTGNPTDHTLQDGGFQTARGKGVVISSAALQKAKSSLSESEAVDDKVGVKANHFKKPALGLSSRNNGFLAASGKPMAFSSEALQKAKALFSDITVSEEALKVSEPYLNRSSTTKAFSSPSSTVSKNHSSFANDHRSIGVGKKVAVSADALKKAECLLNEVHKPEDMKEHLTQKADALKTGNVTDQTLQNGGFRSASGKGVCVSSAALHKAKTLSSESNAVDVKADHFKKPLPGLSSRNTGFLAASGKPMALSSEALQKAKALFSDIAQCEEALEVSDTIRTVKNLNRSSTAKAFSSPSSTVSKNYDSSANNQSRSAVGFSTASGKKVAVSADALKKAECLLNEVHEPEVMKEHLTQKGDVTDQTLQNGGFQTASGKGVVISSAALRKAKSLLSESEAVDVKADHYKKPLYGLSSRDTGSLAAGVVTPSAETPKVSDMRGSSVSKAFSSPSCSTSKNYGSSDDNRSGSGGGFCTASGKKVSVSTDALKKAKCLLNDVLDTPEDANKPLMLKEDRLKAGYCEDHTRAGTQQNGGFQTASGKGVVISSAALQKAKSLLSECEAVDDEIGVKPGTRNSGALAARGKHVTCSSKALHAAKGPVGDITLSEETRPVSDTKKSSEGQDGTGGCVSPKNLLKAADVAGELDDGSVAVREADAFFKACDVDGNGEMLVECEESVAPLSESEMSSNTNEDHGSASKYSTNGDASLKTLSSLPFTATKPTSSAFSDLGNGGGFCTASGKKVSVSEEAMTKAKSLLNDSAAFKDTNKRTQPKEDDLPPQDPDEGVAFSFDARKKAKSQCGEAENQINIKSSHSKVPVSCSTPVDGGFFAASGKPVAFSSESLQRAKAVFHDIDLCSKTSSVSDAKRRSHVYEETPHDAENLSCAFTTAGGAKVHVSHAHLLKAKTLFKEDADEESRPSNANPTLDVTEVKSTKRQFNLTTARDEQETKRSVPRVVKSFQPGHENETLQDARMHNCIFNREKALAEESEMKGGKREETFTSPWVGSPRGSPAEAMGNVSGSEVNRTSSSGEGPRFRRTEETSVIIFQSLNFGGCTKTQQEFLAQEALDCTKALLEDESLAGKSLSATSESEQPHDDPDANPRSVEGQRRRGKRVGEDADITVQPPLKRRLLEEFDRTVDEPRGSTLQPQKCCPNSVMKDRSVFKYSVSHHPNVGAHGGEKDDVETRLQNPGLGTSTHSKMPTFVPPFMKNTKTKTRKNTDLHVSVKTPSAFVPPFKKQRTAVEESSSNHCDEKDKRMRLFVPPSNSNSFLPPAIKPQSSADKGKEDMKPVTFADTDNPLINCPTGCVSEESTAEASDVEEVFSRSQDVFLNLENVEMARDMQDMRIRKKKRQKIRPLPGSLFLAKTSGVSRVPLKAAVNGKPPARCSPTQLYERGVHQHVCEITSENAETFRFSLKQFHNVEAFTEQGGVQLADGGWLIPSNDGTAGREEFYRALCDTPGVDPKLMSEEWVFNHYRWIVWKQASMERSFPETMGSLRLTPEQVLLQLKYRYDVEIDHSRRPALRKIMEKDDTSAKTLVLCVCGVVSSGRSPNKQRRSDAKAPQGSDAKVENSSAVVCLTDGWYGIKAQLDEPLTAMLHKGRLAVGGKLIIYGAQLVGSQDACSPLEAPESLMLKIYANSTRPARWDTKLGFHKDPRPFLLPLSSLFSNGGPVGCVDITVLRSYPIQWMERKPDGGVVFRSVRTEEKEERRYCKDKQKAMEILFTKIQSEYEKEQKGNDKPPRRRRTMSRQDIATLQDGEELHEAVGDDPAYFEAHLSEQQLATLQTYRRSLMEKQQAELQDRYRHAVDAESSDGRCPNRDVTPVWRLCVADSMDQSGRVYQLNLWRPSSDLQSLLKEGCRYKVYNVTTSDGKRRSGVETVQLTGTKKTQFQDLQASQEWLSTHFQPRVSANFVDLQNTEYQPLCGEVDVAGYIISIIDVQGSSPAFYLADGSLNFVKVRCFSSFAHSGLEDVVRPRVLLALSNLQLRGQSTHPTPVVFAGDLTVFSTNPKEAHLQESLCQLRNLVQTQENFLQAAEEKLSLLITSGVVSSVSSPACLQPRTPLCSTDRRQDAGTSRMPQQPVRGLDSVTPVSANPPAASSSTEKDPKSLKRRRALDYLSRIPSPPSLSRLSSVASPCVKKTFNPPRRSATPGTLTTAQTPARKPAPAPPPRPLPAEDEWVNDEELAMIDTQNLRDGDSSENR